MNTKLETKMRCLQLLLMNSYELYSAQRIISYKKINEMQKYLRELVLENLANCTEILFIVVGVVITPIKIIPPPVVIATPS